MSKGELHKTDTNFVLNFEITNRVTRMEEGKYQYYLNIIYLYDPHWKI